MIDRRLKPLLLAALADTPVVYLQGPRQSGKSTLAQSLGGGRRYLSLDTAAVRAAASADPEGFVAGLGGPVALDEAQRVPELALAVKAAVDADREAGRFLLTGSANVMALPRVSESLAGRVEVHTLWPLAEAEVEGAGETAIDRLFAENLGLPPPLNADPAADLLKTDAAGRLPRGPPPAPTTPAATGGSSPTSTRSCNAICASWRTWSTWPTRRGCWRSWRRGAGRWSTTPTSRGR